MSSRRTSSIRKTPTLQRVPTVQKTVSIPTSVVDKVQSTVKVLWDQSCPLGAVYLWITVFLAVYYMFWMPETTLSLKQDDGTVSARTVTKTTRGFLVLATLLSGVVGFWIIKRGCISAGTTWSVLWFVVASVLGMVITQLILAASEHITIPDAGRMLRQLSGNKIKV